MKNIKYMIIGSIITLFFIFFLSICLVDKRLNRKIVVEPIKDYSVTITNLKNDIDRVNNIECKSSFNNMIDRINKTYFKEDTTVKKYYEAYYKDNKSFINYYNDIIDNCKLESDDSIYIEMLSSIVYPNQVKEEYNESYQILFKDNYSNLLNRKDDDKTGTYINKTMELRVVNKLLNKVLDEKDK